MGCGASASSGNAGECKHAIPTANEKTQQTKSTDGCTGNGCIAQQNIQNEGTSLPSQAPKPGSSEDVLKRLEGSGQSQRYLSESLPYTTYPSQSCDVADFADKAVRSRETPENSPSAVVGGGTKMPTMEELQEDLEKMPRCARMRSAVMPPPAAYDDVPTEQLEQEGYALLATDTDDVPQQRLQQELAGLSAATRMRSALMPRGDDAVTSQLEQHLQRTDVDVDMEQLEQLERDLARLPATTRMRSALMPPDTTSAQDTDADLDVSTTGIAVDTKQ